jgi:hypothetical protein
MAIAVAFGIVSFELNPVLSGPPPPQLLRASTIVEASKMKNNFLIKLVFGS